MRYLELIKYIETESRMVVARGCKWVGGGMMWSFCLMGIELQFFKTKRILEIGDSDGCTI